MDNTSICISTRRDTSKIQQKINEFAMNEQILSICDTVEYTYGKASEAEVVQINRKVQ